MYVTLAVAAREVKTHDDGTLDIFGVFDEVTSPELPCIIGRMIVAVSLTGDVAEVGHQRTIAIPLMAPDGKQIGNASREFVLPEAPRSGSRPHFRAAFRLTNVVFPEAGPYHFSIKIDNDVKGTVPVYVNQRKGETQ